MATPALAVPPGSPVARVPRGHLGSLAGKLIFGVLGFWALALVGMLVLGLAGHTLAGSLLFTLALGLHFAGVIVGVPVQGRAQRLVQQAEGLYGAGDRRGTVELVVTALRLGPRPTFFHRALLLLVLEAEGRGAWDEVLALVQAARRLPARGMTRVHFILAEAFARAQRGELDAAERSLAAVGQVDLAQVPGAWLAWTRTRALLYFREARYREVMELETQARAAMTAASPRDGRFLALLARAAMQRTEGLFRVAAAADGALAPEDEAWLEGALDEELRR